MLVFQFYINICINVCIVYYVLQTGFGFTTYICLTMVRLTSFRINSTDRQVLEKLDQPNSNKNVVSRKSKKGYKKVKWDSRY